MLECEPLVGEDIEIVLSGLVSMLLSTNLLLSWLIVLYMKSV